MIHDVKDTDTHFIIDGASRTVKNESDVKSMLVQYDHNSEQFSFKVPREFDNHDLSLCNTVRVHFINVDRTKRMENKGFNTVTETLKICPDDDKYVICSWLIPREATQLVGILCFVIQFACIENDKVLYSWNTAKYSGVTIAEGINADEEVANEYTEILTQWENELKANQITKIEQTTKSTEDDGVNVWTATFGDGRTQDFQVRNGSKGSTGLIGSIQTIQGYPLHFFVGTQEEYDELTPEQTQNLFAIITNDSMIDKLIDGSFVVGKAKEAQTAITAKVAEKAKEAQTSNSLAINDVIEFNGLNNDGTLNVLLDDNVLYLVKLGSFTYMLFVDATEATNRSTTSDSYPFIQEHFTTCISYYKNRQEGYGTLTFHSVGKNINSSTADLSIDPKSFEKIRIFKIASANI